MSSSRHGSSNRKTRDRTVRSLGVAVVTAFTIPLSALSAGALPATAMPALTLPTQNDPAPVVALAEATITNAGGLADLALIPRAPGATASQFRVEGIAPGATRAFAQVEGRQSLTFGSVVAADGSFTLFGEIEVYPTDHTVTIQVADAAGSVTVLDTFVGVVAGDVYGVQGQSNAVAWRTGPEIESSPFVRTYGSNVTAVDAPDEQQWNIATVADAGSVGSWALHMAAQIVEDTGVPIAVMNQSSGGKPVEYFDRNDNDPLDLTTNYGRGLYRAEQAGVTDHISAMFYYQGENDRARPEQHEAGVIDLINDWREDYRTLDEIYIFQVREGCAVGPELSVRDAEQRIAAADARVTAISINHVAGFDGCHFGGAGYAQVGDETADLVIRDQMNGEIVGIDAPSAHFARVGDTPSEIELFFLDNEDRRRFGEDPDRVRGGLASSFVLTFDGGSSAPSNVIEASGMLTLQFDEAVPAEATLSNSSDGEILWTGPGGRSMLAFTGLPVAAEGTEQPAQPADDQRPGRATQMRLDSVDEGVVIHWEPAADTDVTAYLVFRMTPNGPARVGSSATTWFLDRSAPDGTLDYYIRAVDGSGNIGWRNGIRSVTRGGDLDTVRPTPPRGLQSVAADGGSALSWKVSRDDVGVVGYRVYEADTRTIIATVDAPSFLMDAAVGPVFVKAIDAAGNESWRSNVHG